MSTVSSLRDTIFSIPITDTHTHYLPWESLPQPVTPEFFIQRWSYMRMHWTQSGALNRKDARNGEGLYTDWPSISAAIDTIKNISYYRIMLDGVRKLYDLEFEELDKESFEELGRRVAAANSGPSWYCTVLREKSNFETICQDSPLQFDRELLTKVSRMDSYVWFGSPAWREPVVRKHGIELTSTVEGLVGCLRQDFQDECDDGAAAIKSHTSWGRSLVFEEVDQKTAEDALVRCEVNPSDKKAVKTLGDFMMNRIAGYCAEFGLPLQVHTGPAAGTDHMIDYANPLHLNSLVLRNPDTQFSLFHGGGPFINECMALATQFPNVSLDLCWVFGHHWLRNALDNWIEFVPMNKLTWGSDINLVEEGYAVSQHFRGVLADMLTDRVESGYFSRSTAEEFARAILHDNGLRLLRVRERADTSKS